MEWVYIYIYTHITDLKKFLKKFNLIHKIFLILLDRQGKLFNDYLSKYLVVDFLVFVGEYSEDKKWI